MTASLNEAQMVSKLSFTSWAVLLMVRVHIKDRQPTLYSLKSGNLLIFIVNFDQNPLTYYFQEALEVISKSTVACLNLPISVEATGNV
jgi:hypothetical protein